MAITTIKIFPPIGVARLGNSPTEYFIGPEIPRTIPIPTNPNGHDPTPGKYRDARCRIKRQAARFHLFAYDETGALIGLIDDDHADVESIEWTVHLANKKGSANSRNPLESPANVEIDPGPRTVTGPNQSAGFNTGKFMGVTVDLGEMRTDDKARLLVLGGSGLSASPANEDVGDYYNNKGWFDDVSDGPVKATVKLNGVATPITAEPAWVICAPARFAPHVNPTVTLYDVLFQRAIDANLSGVSEPASPSLTNDILPILDRIFQTFRVSDFTGPPWHNDFNAGSVASMTGNRRQAVFNELRDPDNPSTSGDMPKHNDDGLPFTLTRVQYSMMKKWKDGTFTDDSVNWSTPPTSITPEGLTRAALEACVGGPFFPGIEAGKSMRDTFTFSEPFRLNQTGMSAGDVTAEMALPWQADFLACRFDGFLPWWPSHRPDEVYLPTSPDANSEGWTAARGGDGLMITTYKDMVEKWQQLGFVTEVSNKLVETERSVICKTLFIVIDRSHFSQDEVNAELSGGPPAIFKDVFYVIADGFTPAELGISTANPTQTQLESFAPSVSLQATGGLSGISARPHDMLLQFNSLLGAKQRVTFVYQLEFTSAAAFTQETREVTVRASKAGQQALGWLTLMKQPNPYMVDGQTSWLSTDLRVFQVTEGDSPFGSVVGSMGNTAAAATTFIKNTVDHFNNTGPANHPFDNLVTSQQSSKLELSRTVGGKRVFNFAVAKVRYKAAAMPANDVRVFFRLFKTAATGTDYNQSTTYRTSHSASSPISLLGLEGGYTVTLPFYGDARIDSSSASLTTQPDTLNKRNLQPGGANEVHEYFGCWLDINQTKDQFPNKPPAGNEDGPWTSGRQPIQTLIRGLHQCLVAEVHFSGDPIPHGARPANNDNLAQRNLMIVETNNPGSDESRLVQHTLEIKATRPVARPAAMVAAGDGAEVMSAALVVDRETQFVEPGPDELMIRWGSLPRDTEVTLYMADIDADTVLNLAAQQYDVTRLERVDDYTIRCLPADVTYIPLPPGRTRNTPALLSMHLPPELKRGQLFSLTVHQISNLPRNVLGSFQVDIPVGLKADLVEPELRHLSVIKHIASTLQLHDPWYPIFLRYVDGVAGRVRGFGGDPDSVVASPDGDGYLPGRGGLRSAQCVRYGWLMTILIALLLPALAINPLLSLIPLLFIALAGWAWYRTCSPSSCLAIRVGIEGIALGLLLLLVLNVLLSISGQVVLAGGVVALVILVMLSRLARC